MSEHRFAGGINVLSSEEDVTEMAASDLLDQVDSAMAEFDGAQ